MAMTWTQVGSPAVFKRSVRRPNSSLHRAFNPHNVTYIPEEHVWPKYIGFYTSDRFFFSFFLSFFFPDFKTNPYMFLANLWFIFILVLVFIILLLFLLFVDFEFFSIKFSLFFFPFRFGSRYFDFDFFNYYFN